jgi:lipid II:glycine glycyltransferase (peptidoglycan interpeptide bridge formation enzyme)
VIKIINKKDDWHNLLSSIGNYDFYHTYDYHQTCKSKSDSAVILKYEHNGTVIGLPLLIREIDGSSYLDAISVYGYSGPISKGISENFDLNHYKNSLTQFFIKEKIISVFLRLNPYLPYQNIILYNFGELSYLGKVVNVNLTLSLEEQRQKYHRRLKNHVNKANRDCRVKKAVTKEDFQIFKDLYFENMDRVDAKDFYYFNDDYFEGLINSEDFETETLLAIHNETGKTIAACMFIKTNKTVQYHLSGASSEYLHLNGVKLLIDNMRIEATAQGYESFNLGGGLGGSIDDSLFRFKSSFSDEFHHFFVWKLIVNQSKYNQLCRKNKVHNHQSSFFPLYRYNEFFIKNA